MELGLTVYMFLVEAVGYPLGYSINMLLCLVLGTYFGTQEVYMVGFLPVTMAGLMIGNVEVYSVGLSLVLPLVSQI